MIFIVLISQSNREMNVLKDSKVVGAPGWLRSWLKHATRDLRDMSSSPTIGVDFTFKK